jgi:glc operon protein GlcG
MHQTYSLSHADAAKLIEAVREELEKENKGAAIAVADAHGELMAFLRTDGCPLASINIAINKAFTASRERKESRALGDSSREKVFPLTNYGDLRYVGWGGGVPIVYHGQVIGGIGVSGLPEAEDMVLARKAASLIS